MNSIHKRKIKAGKNDYKDEKPLQKIMHNVYGKTLENWRNRTDIKLSSNEKGYLKQTSKPSYMF